ncbi:MAG: hypothetical protein EXR72_26005 [Myxococcales bacterium]|nr:hypothetical protein [Myxococcales bacterium]
MTYGRWIPLADAVAPAGPGLFQARYGQGSDGLVAYPTGRSAMACYGADDEQLANAVAALREGLDPGDLARLFVRFAAPDPGRRPSETIAAALAAFSERFGAPPVLNREI